MNDSIDVRPSFGALRVTLAFITGVLLLAAYGSLFQPEFFAQFYGPTFPDLAHRQLLAAMGVLLLVFVVGGLLAFLQPLRYSGIVLLIALLHFAIFVLDVVFLARGPGIPWYYLAIEMAYALIVFILLVRFFPVPLKLSSLTQTADALVDAVEKRQKDKDKKGKEENKSNVREASAPPPPQNDQL